MRRAPPGIYALAHDARDGAIDRSKGVAVLMYATSGISASFSIGEQVVGIPMIERSRGHYIGLYRPFEEDGFSAEPLVVTVEDSLGRTVMRQVGKERVSLVQ